MRYWEEVRPYEDPFLARHSVSRRRPPTPSIPDLRWEHSRRVQRELFSAFGLEAFADSITAEMHSRPTPHVSKIDARMIALRRLLAYYLPRLLVFLAAELKPPVQTYNKVSKLGWPYMCVPTDKAARSLWSYLIARGNPAYLAPSFGTMNVRLQPEEGDKIRIMQFISDRGEVYEKEVTAEDRYIFLRETQETLQCARTRGVFGKQAPNQTVQVVDTAFNNALGSYPVCKHNMYGEDVLKGVRRFHLALDVKHMERFTAAGIGLRTEIIGGNYKKVHDQMDSAGYVVPSDTWRTWWRLRRVPRDLILQFSSGHSAVAPSQKEILICILWAMHVDLWGMEESSALKAVLSGDTPFLNIKNFGDDNFWSAHTPEVLEHAFKYCSRFLHCEKEDPPKFLGFEFHPHTGFKLSERSYLLKTWLSERAPLSSFRKFPYFGWVQKRKIYLQYGVERRMVEVFEMENKLLESVGYSWRYVEAMARKEAEQIQMNVLPDYLFGKDYLLTPEERIASGAFDGIMPEDTAPILKDAIDPALYKG